MHRQLPCNLNKKLEDTEQSCQWIKFEDIKGKTESTIVAAQGQAIIKNYFKNTILKEKNDSKYQLCIHE